MRATITARPTPRIDVSCFGDDQETQRGLLPVESSIEVADFQTLDKYMTTHGLAASNTTTVNEKYQRIQTFRA